MDLPQYLHHHTRYAPSRPHSHSHSPDPNLPNYPHARTHHYHHHTPTPPSPPPPPNLRPPPQSKTLPPPPPPPPHPRRSFSPSPIEPDHSRTFHHRSTTAAIDSDRPPRRRYYIDSGPDYWDHRDRRSNYSPTRKPYRLDSDGGGPRFRSEYEDRDRRGGDDDEGYRRLPYKPETASYRELGFPQGSRTSGCYDESAYEELLRSGRRYENYEIQRWGLERPSPEDLYDPFELDERDDDGDDCDEGRIVSGDREYYGSESGRFSTSSSSSNRWKQIQKKSALLRLQARKPRDRGYFAYYDNAGGAGVSFRGKEQYEEQYKEQYERDEGGGGGERGGGGGGGGGEEERGGVEVRSGSPLELDVSFKSNSLVAKTVSNRNEKRDSGSDMDCSESPPRLQRSEDVVNLEASSVVLSKTLSPEKEAVKVKEEVTSSGINSQICSVVTNDAFGKSEVERASEGKILDKDGNSVGSGQRTPVKVIKKTKVVKKTVPKKTVLKKTVLKKTVPKKTVKMVIKPPTSLPKSKIDEPGTSFVHSSFAGSETKAETSSGPDDLPALPLNDEVAASIPNVASDDCGTVMNSYSKSNGNNSTACLSSSIPEEINTDQLPLNLDTPVKCLVTVSNFDDTVTDSVRVATGPEIGCAVDIGKPISQSGDIVALDSVVQKESSEAKLSVEGSLNSVFVNAGNMNQDTSNIKDSDHGAETTLDIDSGIKSSHQEIMVHDILTVDCVGQQPCRSQQPASLQNVASVEEHPKAISSSDTNMAVGLSSTGEAKDVRPKVRRTRWDSDEVYVKKGNKVTVSNSGNVSFSGKPPSPNGSSKVVEVCAIDSQNIPNSEGDARSVILEKKRKVPAQLDFLRTSNNCSAVDTTIVGSILKDHRHAELPISGVQKLNVISQPGNEGLNWKNSVDGFSGTNLSARIDVSHDINETSPKSTKRRKVSASHLILPTAQIKEGSADKSTCHTQESFTCDDVPTHQADKVAASSIDYHRATANLIPQEGINVCLDSNLAGVSSDAPAAANDDMKFKHQGIEACCPSQSRNEEREDGTQVMDVDSSREKDVATNEQVMMNGETALNGISSELQSPHLGNTTSCTIMESDYVSVKNKLPFVSNCMLSPANGNEVPTTNSNDEGLKSVADTLLNTGSSESLPNNIDLHMVACNPSAIKISDGNVSGDNRILEVKSKTNLSSDLVIGVDHSVMGKTEPLKLQDSKKTTPGPNLISAESALKNQLGQATHKIVPGRPYSAFTTSNKTVSSTHISKPRTWHRTANSSASSLPASMPLPSAFPPQRQLPQRSGKLESTSYVRKGNSLVRKPAPVAAVPQTSHGFSSSVYQLNSSGIDGLKKDAGSETRVEIKNPPSVMRMGEMNAPSDRPTVPLPNGAKVSTSAAITSGVPTSNPLVEPLLSGCLEPTSDPISSGETKDTEGSVKDSLESSDTQENHSVPMNNLHDGNSVSSNMKKITYVKRKLNQLVASSDHSDLSVHNADKSQPLSYDGYYKRRKNQLIRSSLESNGKQAVVLLTENLNSVVQRARKIIPSRAFNKKRSQKPFAKTGKKNSLVWTSNGTHLPDNSGSSFDHQKILPHLFPWKRTSYWKSVLQSQASNFSYSSSSTMRKKLLLSRMRDTVYTRSTHGFSLRKYKVLSVGGSSLKWSKSIENRSKKVNEETTRAVAAVEKKRREYNGAACSSSGSKMKNNSPGKRIFRIGSVRYKMDPSRRTLKRISDDESSSSALLTPEKDAKKSYVPRRLVIGNDEYVRIGNGNQLIRDPKKRTRILASERVRWSLHTARQRLAKKRKYCQFFTRFGKCNKGDGKCPYIHDPSKVAVCTKFLNGLCSNTSCKLTHKVIPERMPDCSFFLQGLCSIKNCSYRHVNVNPKASTCEGFLKGYCADGNECRKKHSYVCPAFEATGTCPQGPKCKLHHPRKRTKGKIKKRSREQKNGWGRYFVSKDVSVSSPVPMSGKHRVHNGDDIFGNEFISIDVSDEEARESNDPPEQTTFYDSDPSELELDDLDELIKPIRLLEKMKTNVF